MFHSPPAPREDESMADIYVDAVMNPKPRR